MLLAIVMIVVAVLAGCSSDPARTKKEAPPAAAAKILQFYASPGVVAPGEPVSICYGVENAATVRIDPPVEKLQPSWNRCFQYAPARTATYKLVAAGADGREVSQSIVVQVAPRAREPEAKRPAAAQGRTMIQLFAASSQQIASGQPATLCYSVQNATSVKIEPGAGPLSSNEKNCVIVTPSQTTTYKLTATGPSGTETDQLQIVVK